MLILICPSETEAQANDIWLGNESSRLSEIGKELAAEIAQHDRIVNERTYVAPQEHIQEFARIVLRNPFDTLDALTDRSMGNLTGRSYRETLAEFPRRNWLAWQRSFWIAPPDGESFFDISDRVLTAFRTKILPVESKETVVVVCAPDVLRILLGYLTRLEEVEIPKIEIQTTVPYVINGDIEAAK